MTNTLNRTRTLTHVGASRRRLLGVVATTVAAALVWLVATGPLGVELVARGTAIGLANVVGTALLAGLAGWAVVVPLERRTAHPRRWWVGLGLAVLIVSLLGPLAATTLAALLTLVCLHLVVGAGLLVTLTPRYRG